MQKNIVRVAAVAALVLPLAAVAAPHQKPGLWQVSTQMQMSGAGMPQQPQIPPEQLAKMQAMGIQMPQMSPGGGMAMNHSSQICITPEQAARDEAPSTGNDQCQVTNTSFSGSTYSATVVCNSPQMQGTGTIKGTFSSDEAYTANMHFTGTMQHGPHSGPVDMTTNVTGKWQGSDCGSVKPFTPPPGH